MLRRFDAGETAEAAAQHILALYDEANPHHWCHTISNAMIVALGLLWGEKDFTRIFVWEKKLPPVLQMK